MVISLVDGVILAQESYFTTTARGEEGSYVHNMSVVLDSELL